MNSAQKKHHWFSSLPPVEALLDSISSQIAISDPASPDRHAQLHRVETRLLEHAPDHRSVVTDFGHRDTDEATNAGANTSAGAHASTPSAPWALLAVVSGPGKGQIFPLQKLISNVGRDHRQDVALDAQDPYVSRFAHATITREKADGRTTVMDGEKQNPVLLNGRKLVGSADLSHLDQITVGTTTLQFVIL